MATFPGYDIIAELRMGTKTVTYRAQRIDDAQPVVLKMLRAQYPDLDDIAQLQREHAITQGLPFDGIVKPYAFERQGHSVALVLEDFGGVPLSNLIDAGPVAVAQFLPIALQLAHTLGQLHQAEIIHKDVKPSNILLNPATKQVKLSDFGIAAHRSAKELEVHSNTALEGTLAYIAPEQTGRMNREVDQRADLYALGVTFYEMLTGRLPFATNDPVELVHAQIARQPVPPARVVPGLPQMLSAIVLKLMAKTPAERYQSGYGLQADLARCWEQWQAHGTITAFTLGQRDGTGQFRLPDKLYGRADDLAVMHATLERTRQGAVEVLLVSGSAGIGKSTLVYSLIDPAGAETFFVSGKFDQMQRTTPYSGIIQALRELVRRLLTQGEAELALWRERLLEALDGNGQVMIDVMPEVELIIGPQAAVASLAPTEAHNRFHLVFRTFVRVFAQHLHPLVLFLDDLHWADTSSFKLLELLIGDPAIQSLLFIGAYRDDAVGPHHPLTALLQAIAETGTRMQPVPLAPLDQSAVQELVTDTLACPLETGMPLAALVYQKTEGNPFFTKTFLRSLYEDQILVFDPMQGWQWDAAAVQRRDTAANAVELTTRKLTQLAPATLATLKLAACIGSRFDLPTLATVSQQRPADVREHLSAAVQEQLVATVDDDGYAFAHDRVQEAAYTLMPDAEKQRVHHQIGQILLDQTDAEHLPERVFDIVAHLNRALPLVDTADAQLDLARLNLLAGYRARAAAAHAAALQYLQVGLQLLPAAAWNEQYDLALALHVAATEAAFMSTDFALLETLGQAVLQHARTLLDQVPVYELQMQAAISQNQMVRAVKIGLDVLEMLGVTLIGWGDADLTLPPLDAPLARAMDAPEHLAAMRILVTLAPPAIQTRAHVYPRGILTQIRYCLDHGHTDLSAVSYGLYGCVLLAEAEQDIDQGYHAGQLALKLLETFQAHALTAKVYNLFNGHIRHWREPVRTTLQPFRDGIQSGLACGDLQYVGYNARDLCAYLFFTSEGLEDLEQQQTHSIDLLTSLRQQHSAYIVQIWQQVGRYLLEREPRQARLRGASFDAEQMLPRLMATNNRIVLFNMHLAEALLAYLFGDDEQALASAEDAAEHVEAAGGLLHVGLHAVLHALALLARYHHATPAAQAQTLAHVARTQQRMQPWPAANYAHFIHLLAAEQARVLEQTEQAMEQYDQAIAAALEQNYPHFGGIAYERAAAFYLGIGRDKIAQVYLHDAYYCYKLWGTTAKLTDLEERYAPLFDRRLATQVRGEDPRTITRTATGSVTTSSTTNRSALDVLAVVKASQALASEVVLADLLEQLLRTVIENAGAERGVLLLEQRGQLVIEAVGSVVDQQMQMLSVLPVNAGEQLAMTIINYVRRSGESLVVADARQERRFAHDPYIGQHQPQSILCVPISNQGKLIGVVYLENNLATDAFTPARSEVVQILAAQAAISLENARLYDEMQREMNERRRAEEALRSITEGTASVTGGDFFRSLVRYLAEAFGVSYAFVSECVNLDKTRVRTLAFLKDMAFTDNIEYDLAETPCEGVIGGEMQYYPDRLEELFPKDARLQSYLGAPLRDAAGNVLGHLAVLDAKPMHRANYNFAILRIFAARAGTELERQRADAALRRNEEHLRHLNEQLEDYNRNLEQKVTQRTREIERRRQVAERLRDMLAILNSNRALETILQYIVAEGIGLLGTDSCAIFRLDVEQSTLVVQAARGLPAEYVDGLAFPVDRSFLGQAIRSRQPVIIPDLTVALSQREIGIDRRRRHLLMSNYRTLLAVPLLRQGASAESDEIYGGMALYFPESKQFTTEELELAMAFADQAALAIDNTHLRQQVEQAAINEERGRLARELHDSVTQSLYSLTLLAEGWRRMVGAGRLDGVGEALGELGGIGQQALKEMRLLVHQLRPPVLEKAGLLGALHQRLAAVERRAGIEARLLSDELGDLPPDLEEGLYRIAQEALNNALKHAMATSVVVHIRASDDWVELEVADDGTGFDVAQTDGQGGIGLESMRERAESLGGALAIASLAESGTKVTVRVDRTYRGNAGH